MKILNNSVHFGKKEDLTEDRMGLLLSNILSEDLVKGKNCQVPVPNLKGRGPKPKWDYLFTIQKTITVIEFDGNHHYQNIRKIQNDFKKDSVAKELGYSIVHWPYWLQADSRTIFHYFNINYSVTTDFPHGFKGGTLYYPSCFCEKGIDRFVEELRNLPHELFDEVIDSLKFAVKTEGSLEWVLPSRIIKEFEREFLNN